jgi:hypothetical protein
MTGRKDRQAGERRNHRAHFNWPECARQRLIQLERVQRVIRARRRWAKLSYAGERSPVSALG